MVKEAVYFKARAEDIMDAVEEANLENVEEVDPVVAMGKKETIGAVEKMVKWCDVMTDPNWRFIRHMTSLTMNITGYLRHK